MSKHKPVILFFLADGGIPTPEEKEFIMKGRAEGVVISPRNRNYVGNEHKPEQCDGVHAFKPEHIPKIYEKAPGIERALRGFLEEKEERRRLVGDEKAPPQPETNKPDESDKKANIGGWKKNQ